MNRIMVMLLVSCFYLAVQGCTNRGCYEGFQEQQRQECHRYQSRAEIQDCLDRVNSTTYDEYEKTREDIVKASE